VQIQDVTAGGACPYCPGAGHVIDGAFVKDNVALQRLPWELQSARDALTTP
jgi:hypothetical protein